MVYPIMESKDLKDIKIVDPKNKKNILFVVPKIKENSWDYPHNGIAILSGILKKRGHNVLVADYSFMRGEEDTDISFFIEKINPDIIGISISTPNKEIANELINKIRGILPSIPIMVGGPHPTVYTQEFLKDKRVDYIFVGEAELTILGVIENSKREKKPKTIIQIDSLNLDDIPFPDYKAFFKWEELRGYPILTSRGCPNSCTFCTAAELRNRKWRARSPENCIAELEFAKKELNPHIHICVWDDNPTVDKDRFNKFLYLFNKKIKNSIHIINTRADGIDETFISLLKKCGCHDLTLGIESAHPEVYKMINKGQSFEQIEKACNLIKKFNLKLGMTFIVGLPKDNLKRIKYSINFVKKFNPFFVNIALIVPFKGTPIRKWYEENGAKIYDEKDVSLTPKSGFECEEPCVETEDFTKEERKKAFYMFLLSSPQRRLKLKDIFKIYRIVKNYGLHWEFFYWLPRGLIYEISDLFYYFKLALKTYRNEGFVKLVKRYKLSNKRRE